MANLIRGLSENGGVVFCGVDSTQIVRKAEKLHTTSATWQRGTGPSAHRRGPDGLHAQGRP